MITEVVECGYFWCQIITDDHQKNMNKIHDKMNGKVKYPLKKLVSSDLRSDMLCVAQFSDDNTPSALYRAKIIHFDKKENKCEILYIDYGNKEVRYQF